MSDYIFDPDRCDVPPLPPLPRIRLIPDCDIPPAPDPFFQPGVDGPPVPFTNPDDLPTDPPEPPVGPENCLVTLGGATCESGGTQADGPVPIKTLYFSKAVFRVWMQPSSLCEGLFDMLVDMGGGDTDSLFWQGPGGQTPRWTIWPRIGKALTIGTTEPGWLFIWSNPGRFGLTSGGAQNWITPTAPAPRCDYFLVVDSVAGNCHQLAWLGPGVSGCFRAYTCPAYSSYSYEIDVTVTRGIITSITGITPRACYGGPVCDPGEYTAPDPCRVE